MAAARLRHLRAGIISSGNNVAPRFVMRDTVGMVSHTLVMVRDSLGMVPTSLGRLCEPEHDRKGGYQRRQLHHYSSYWYWN